MRDKVGMPVGTPRASASGFDAVEIKVNLVDSEVDRGLAIFELTAATAERRRIWFCEHLDGHGGPTALPLFARGLILRVRSRAGSTDDSTLKLRGPEGCIDARAWHRRTQEFGKQARIEGDWVADRHLVSASLDNDIDDDRIDEVLAERPPRVGRLFSGAQERLAGDWLLPLDRLGLLGAVQALKWKDRHVAGLGHRIAAEVWQVDDSLRFLELSIRVELEEQDPIQAQEQLERAVRDHGLDIAPAEETKTRLVLEHLAAAAEPP